MNGSDDNAASSRRNQTKTQPLGHGGPKELSIPGNASSERGKPPQRPSELEWAWEVKGYTYWEQKRDFSLKTDKYPFWCLFAVEHGSFEYAIGERQGIAGSGSLVLCPPFIAFRRFMQSPFLTFHFVALEPAFPASPPLAEPEEAKLPACFAPADRQRLFGTFDKWKQIGALRGANRLSLIAHYWNDIWKTWCLECPDANGPRPDGANADELMNMAARRLEARSDEPFGVKELAHELGLSPVQLIRRFRSAYGITPGNYLTSIRLERACRLLRESRMTVEQIAAACGYATGYYLSRLFAARIGMTPSEYRRQNRV